MSLRVIANINATNYYVAFDEINDEVQPYVNWLSAFKSFSVKAGSRVGGIVEPKFGSISYTAEMFENEWIPPNTHSVKAYLNTTLIVDGTGMLSGLPLATVDYDIYGPSNNATVATGFTGTFFAYFTAACATLGYTLDTTIATNYNVNFTLTKSKILFDVLDEMARSLNHGFYILNNVLYLVDLLKDDGTTISFDEFDFHKSDYSAPTPYSLFSNGTNTLIGTYPFADKEFKVSTPYQTVSGDIGTQLARSKTILNKYWIELQIPIIDTVINYGQKITFTDTSRVGDLSVTMWVRELNYRLDDSDEYLTISGEGALS